MLCQVDDRIDARLCEWWRVESCCVGFIMRGLACVVVVEGCSL
jgi:hypothetical protein